LKILILKTIQDNWLYINPNAIMALSEEYNGTTISLAHELPDSTGRKSKSFTIAGDIDILMNMIEQATG
jgi:hypothetical protein